MADRKKPPRDPIAALLHFSAEYDQSAAEAEQELRDAGVDVDGFLAQLNARLAKQKEEDRLAWLKDAQQGLAHERAKPRVDRYKDMDRRALVENYKERRTSPEQAQAFFHKLDSITDDDLRTLLSDLDELDDDEDPS